MLKVRTIWLMFNIFLPYRDLILWCLLGKNLYNNEHVAIKLVSFYTHVESLEIIVVLSVWNKPVSACFRLEMLPLVLMIFSNHYDNNNNNNNIPHNAVRHIQRC